MPRCLVLPDDCCSSDGVAAVVAAAVAVAAADAAAAAVAADDRQRDCYSFGYYIGVEQMDESFSVSRISRRLWQTPTVSQEQEGQQTPRY